MTVMTSMTPTTITDTIDTHLAAYCEPDADRRKELVAATWAEDGSLFDPPFDGTGHDAIAGMGGVVLTHYPNHTFVRTSAVDAHHNFARYSWALVAPDGTHAVSGIDVVETGADGRLVKVVGFFGPLAANEAE
jgi:hypothetical protein